jgi:hypothetical protein
MGKNRELHEAAVALVAAHGGNVHAASRASGIARTTLRNRLTLDPAIADGMDAVGTDVIPRLLWAKSGPDAEGMSYSAMLRPGTQEFTTFLDLIRDTVGDLMTGKHPKLPPRFEERAGNLMVLDPADVHIGKLSVASETGYTYDEAIAEHRLVEGCRVLLERGVKSDVTTVLFVIGNDISHIDTPRRTTTSGTAQDTAGSLFSIFRVAQRAYIRIVNMILEMGLHVVIMFNPSNHDWVQGFTIAQVVQAWFRNHENVTVSDYGVSERHRKYMRFGRNLVGLTHGDGAKEGDLSDIMLTEARSHHSDAILRYWYVHHYHHKMRRALGVRSQQREKDHIAMTVIRSGPGAMEGDNCHIEFVRSPSPPDGWHDRNGYLNRQAVEAFVHCPQDGQIDRFTRWF